MKVADKESIELLCRFKLDLDSSGVINLDVNFRPGNILISTHLSLWLILSFTTSPNVLRIQNVSSIEYFVLLQIWFAISFES